MLTTLPEIYLSLRGATDAQIDKVLELQGLDINAFFNKILNRNAPSGKGAPETEPRHLELEVQKAPNQPVPKCNPE